MRIRNFIFLMISIVCLVSCKDDENPAPEFDRTDQLNKQIDQLMKQNESKISIEQGLAGSVLRTYCNNDLVLGDGPPPSQCVITPIVFANVHVYKNVDIDSIFGSPYVDSIIAEFVGIVNTDDKGFFEIEGSAGDYSLYFEYGASDSSLYPLPHVLDSSRSILKPTSFKVKANKPSYETVYF